MIGRGNRLGPYGTRFGTWKKNWLTWLEFESVLSAVLVSGAEIRVCQWKGVGLAARQTGLNLRA